MPTPQQYTVPLGHWIRIGGWLVCPVETGVEGVTLKYKQASARVQARAERREARLLDTPEPVDGCSHEV